MTNTAKEKDYIDRIVTEALEILSALGVPMDGMTQRRKERMAKAFIAVTGIKYNQTWKSSRSIQDDHMLLSRQILRFMNEHLGENISDSSYDDIRRKDLLLPVTAGIVTKSALNPDASTNDGTRAYAISAEVAAQIKLYGTVQWKNSLDTFNLGHALLSKRLNRERELNKVAVTIKDGVELKFSPGGHNELQKAIIEEFLPIFGFDSEILYVGDTANKFLYLNEELLKSLNFGEIAHDKLPDVVAFSKSKNWLYLIEAVHSANPITELRKLELEKMSDKCSVQLVFVTAFPDRICFRKHVKDIAWETEVWIADTPTHLIHFNGDKFLGPYTQLTP